MRKTIAALLVMLAAVAVGVARQVAPTKDDAVVVAGDGATDHIVVVNKSHGDITIKVYGYNKETDDWDFLCKVENALPDKKTKAETPFDGNLRRYKFFAVETVGGGKFHYTAAKYRNDLCIYVFDE